MMKRMMNNLRFKNTIVKIAALTVLLTLVVSFTCGCYRSRVESKYKSGNGYFSSVDYTMPDIARFNSLCDSIEKDKNNPFLGIAINDRFTEIFDIYYDMIAMEEVTKLFSAFDITNLDYVYAYEKISLARIDASYRIYSIANQLKSAPGGYTVRTNNNLSYITTLFSEFKDKDENEELIDLRYDYNELMEEYSKLLSTEFTVDAENYTFSQSIPKGVKTLTENEDGSYSWFVSEEDLKQLYSKEFITDAQTVEAALDISAKKREAFGNLLIDLIEVRKKIAFYFGYTDFKDYSYECLGRCYEPEDIEGVKNIFKSNSSTIMNSLNSSLNPVIKGRADTIAADVYENSFVQKVKTMLEAIYPGFKPVADELFTKGRINYEYSPVKQDTGFTVYLKCYDIPFIFIQPNETPDFFDIESFFHEFGHYYQMCVCPEGALLDDIDSMEVLSLALELMSTGSLGVIYDNSAMCKTMSNYELYSVLSTLYYSFIIDDFETRLYNINNLTPDLISDLYYSVVYDYGFISDNNSDIEGFSDKDLVKDEWTGIYHIFSSPFYYESYGISSITAMEIFLSDSPVDTYNQFCMNTAEYNIRENAVACGLSDPLSAEDFDELLTKMANRFY